MHTSVPFNRTDNVRTDFSMAMRLAADHLRRPGGRSPRRVACHSRGHQFGSLICCRRANSDWWHDDRMQLTLMVGFSLVISDKLLSLILYCTQCCQLYNFVKSSTNFWHSKKV